MESHDEAVSKTPLCSLKVQSTGHSGTKTGLDLGLLVAALIQRPGLNLADLQQGRVQTVNGA